MKVTSNTILLKVISIVIIALVLLIPTSMIELLIHDREATQKKAINEVSTKWAHEQTLSGPILSIPFNKYVTKSSEKKDTNNIVSIEKYIHFLPQTLDIKAKITTEKRYRGIYEVVVYKSQLICSGTFTDLNIKDFDIPKGDILWDNAFISVGISDLRGIENQTTLTFDNTDLSFDSGVKTKDVLNSGINSRVSLKKTENASYDFRFTIDLKGSQKLYFVPVGQSTHVEMNSEWNNPSFNGYFLPDNHNVKDDGFHAEWNITHLNRNYPQSWIGNKHIISSSSFGVDLLLPVDNYQKSIRSIRYAILFISLTFMLFFFVEILNKISIHPAQYILVGLALVLFFSLLLSLSEYMDYNTSFIMATLSTIFLIGGYIKATLKSSKLTALISSILLILYGFIFIIIQLQDYALLIGSIFLFAILGLTMYFSRKIDWYNVHKEQRKT